MTSNKWAVSRVDTKSKFKVYSPGEKIAGKPAFFSSEKTAVKNRDFWNKVHT